MTPESIPALPSLLGKTGDPAGTANRLDKEAVAALDVQPILDALSIGDAEVAKVASRTLLTPCTCTETMVYRQEVLENLLSEPALRRGLNALLPYLADMARTPAPASRSVDWSVGLIVDRVRELEAYVDVVVRLDDALSCTGVHAPGVVALRDAVHARRCSHEFETLVRELPELVKRLAGIRSVTIGVNLSGTLSPESAAIVEIDDHPIAGRRTLLGRMLRTGDEPGAATPLRGHNSSLRGFFPPMRIGPTGYENQLVADLKRLLDHVAAPVGAGIQRFTWARSRDLRQLAAELGFFLNAASLVDRLHAAGLPTCRPRVRPVEERGTRLIDSYSASLAIRVGEAPGGPVGQQATIVPNDVIFGGSAPSVWVLTGPNRGGKTTFLRCIGQAHLLFQAGLRVPAAGADMSPVDAVYAHFPAAEGTVPGEGRLDEEARRLGEIFRSATPDSLILLNEVLAGTNSFEGLSLARDALRALALLGARTIYVTHLLDLAAEVYEGRLSAEGGLTMGSLTSTMLANEDEPMRTFKIVAGPPLPSSYASQIAEQHGIRYSQLVELFRARGLVRDVPADELQRRVPRP